MAIVKPYISPTQLEMFSRCPEAYRRRYLERDIIPPGMALIRGTTFHDVAAINLKQKIETREDLRASEMMEIAADKFDQATAGGYVLTADEAGQGAKAVLGAAKDEAVSLAEFHTIHQAPDYQPLFVEEAIRIDLPSASHDLLGVIDVATENDAVIDFKTTGRRKGADEADKSVQLTTYAASFKAKTGRPAKRIALDVVVKGKRDTNRQILETERNDADYAALAARIEAITAAINAGYFPPTSPGNWNCAAKWCGYYSTCRYVNAERKAASSDE